MLQQQQAVSKERTAVHSQRHEDKYLADDEASCCMGDGSEVPLPRPTCSEARRSRYALGVLAADEMLDRSEMLPSSCWEASPLLLLRLRLQWESADSSDPGADSESDEKSRESVSPASAIRRRRRSDVPSRLQIHA